MKFITEYIRRVNENGHAFTTGHFFILLLELKVNDLENRLGKYIKVLVDEFKVPFEQYQRFMSGLLDSDYKNAFKELETQLYS